MKKLIYIVLFAFVTAMSVTACTEEDVKPRTEINAGGLGDTEPK